MVLIGIALRLHAGMEKKGEDRAAIGAGGQGTGNIEILPVIRGNRSGKRRGVIHDCGKFLRVLCFPHTQRDADSFAGTAVQIVVRQKHLDAVIHRQIVRQRLRIGSGAVPDLQGVRGNRKTQQIGSELVRHGRTERMAGNAVADRQRTGGVPPEEQLVPLLIQDKIRTGKTVKISERGHCVGKSLREELRGNIAAGKLSVRVHAITDHSSRAAVLLRGQDIGMAVVKFKNGAVGTIEGTVNVYPKNLEETLYLFGETGTVKLGGTSTNNIDVWSFADEDAADTKNQGLQEATSNVYGNGHTSLFADMVDAIEHDRKPYVDAVAGRNALEMILAIYQSAATGKPVKLPLEHTASTDFEGRFD